MVIIYDFDGTLTPYGIPQYAILKKFGYDEGKMMERVSLLMRQEKLSIYQAYFKTYEDILRENNQQMNYSNVILGSKDVEFNPGVLDYFCEMQESNPQVKHYIVTSGLLEYVRNTKLSSFVKCIYGTTYHREEDIFTTLDRLITDEDKPNIIEMIMSSNPKEKIVYIGDGLTDRYAFHFVHSIGGICIYVGSTDDDFQKFESLKKEGIVDEYFIRDYSSSSELRKFIKNIVHDEMSSK